MPRIAASLLSGLAALLAVAPAAAQAPQSAAPIKLVYAYAAGNSGDALCRIAADRLAKRLDRSVIVENRGGASGRIGTRAVIAAPPDGNTLLCTPMAPIVLHPVTHSNLGYEPFEALAPVSQLATFDIAVVVGPAAPAKTAAELVAWIKANPDRGAYGTPGLGGLPHFFAVMFAGRAGIALRNVPYAGSGALMNDLLAGQLPLAVVPASDFAELHRSGKARILATSAREPTSLLPDVPTFKAAGFDIAGEGWYAVYAPAKTPPEIIERTSVAIQASLRDKDTRDRISGIGFTPTGTTPAELQRQQQSDRTLWTPSIKASGFKPTD